MKAQAAEEYLIIVSVALLILIPVIYQANKLLIAYKDDNKISSAKNTVDKLGEIADWVFSQGPPAKRTIEIHIPQGVEEISLDNKTINFKIKTSSGFSDAFYETVSTLQGNIPTNSGNYFVALTAYDDYVDISMVS